MSPGPKILVILGALLIAAGLIWQFAGKYVPPLGRLPGDVVVEKENVRFYFPVVTSILLSVVLSLLAWVFSKMGK